MRTPVGADLMGEKTFKFLSRFPIHISGVTVAFGLMVLAGWILHIQRLKGIVPGQVAVKANTAVCFVLIGFALWLAQQTKAKRYLQVLCKALAAAASLIGLLSFLECWYGWDLRIDQLLFTAGADDLPGSVRPGLMAPISALDFLLLGVSITLLDVKERWSRWVQALFGGVTVVASVFGVLDFVLDPGSTHTHIAPMTALIFFLFAFGVLCARTDWGLGKLLISVSPGGELSRRMLPPSILLPIVIGWLRWKGQESGLYSDWTGLVIMMVGSGLLLTGLTLWTAYALDRIDRTKAEAEESARRLATIVRCSNDGIIGKTLDGIVTSWNPGAEAIYGYSAEEMIGQAVSRVIPADRLDEFEGFLQGLRRGESIRHYETERMRKDGKRISVSVSISPIKDGKGQIIGASTISRDVSERKKAEEELRRVSRYSRSLIEASLDPLVTISKEGKITDVNEATEKATGLSRSRLIGSEFSDYFMEPEKAREGYQQVFEKGFVRDYPLTIRSTSGVVMKVLYNATLFRGAGGEVEGVFAAARDVTELMRTEQELRLSREKLKMALIAGHAGTFDWDIQNDANVWTPEMEEVHGLAPTEFGGKYEDWEALVVPEDLPAAKKCIENSLKTGEFAGEWRIRRRNDGEIRWITARAKILYDDEGKPWRMIGLNLDGTERKRAEEEIVKLNRELEKRVEERTAELKASEQRVRRKLEAILTPEGDLRHLTLADVLDVPALRSLLQDFHELTRMPIAIIDPKGVTLVGIGWQDICTEFHRLHPETCKNCLESDTVLSHGVEAGQFKLYKCRNNLWDGVTPLFLGGQHVGNLFVGQFFFSDEAVHHEMFREQARRYGFDEKRYLAALDRVPRFTREEVDTGISFLAKLAQLLSQLSYSSIRLARSSEQVSRANAELSATVKELEAFTYSVSHDLRAPLRHISGFSKILSEEFSASLPPEAQHHVQRIQDGTRRMGQLVDDLLNLGRVGRKELSLQVAGLRSIVDDVIESLEADIGNRRVEWKISDLPYVECDPALMQQVWQNLLSNALKFTGPRSHSVIEIGQEQRDGKAVVYVRDNGVGFSMKYAHKLFGVFQRLHRAEDFEGTGVGLATVQRIIQKHGGHVWAEAELDKGAAFYFTLGTSESIELKAKAVMAGEKE
jgi:PAS domain S-box-containing protein